MHKCGKNEARKIRQENAKDNSDIEIKFIQKINTYYVSVML